MTTEAVKLYSSMRFEGNGVTTIVALTFDLRKEDRLTVDFGEGILEGGYVVDFDSQPVIVIFDAPLPKDKTITIRRRTDIDRVPYVFQVTGNAQGGSPFNAFTIDTNFDLIVRASQDAMDSQVLASETLEEMAGIRDDSKKYRDEAEEFRDQAEVSKTSAGSSAFFAGNSAQQAEASKNLAYDWANKDVDVPVLNGEYSARHWAEKSKESAGGLTPEIIEYVNENTVRKLHYSKLRDKFQSSHATVEGAIDILRVLKGGRLVFDVDVPPSESLNIFSEVDFNNFEIEVLDGVEVWCRGFSLHFPPTARGLSGGYKGFKLFGLGSFTGDGINSGFFLNMCHVSNFLVENISFKNIGKTHLFDLQGCSNGLFKNYTIEGSSLDYTDPSVRHFVEAIQISALSREGTGYPDKTNPMFYDQIGSENIKFIGGKHIPTYNEDGTVFRYPMRPMGEHQNTVALNIRDITIKKCLFKDIAPLYHNQKNNNPVIQIPSYDGINIIGNTFEFTTYETSKRKDIELYQDTNGLLAGSGSEEYTQSHTIRRNLFTKIHGNKINKTHAVDSVTQNTFTTGTSQLGFELDFSIKGNTYNYLSPSRSIAYLWSLLKTKFTFEGNSILNGGGVIDSTISDTKTNGSHQYFVNGNNFKNLSDITLKFTSSADNADYSFDFIGNKFTDCAVSVRSFGGSGVIGANTVVRGRLVDVDVNYAEAMFQARSGNTNHGVYTSYGNVVSWDGIESPSFRSVISINNSSQDTVNGNYVYVN